MANIKFNARHGLSVGSTPIDVIDSTGAIAASSIPTLNQNTTGTAANITGTYGGTITSSQVTTALEFTPENPANRGAAGGYVPLDSSTKIASTYLPSYVDDVLEYTIEAPRPLIGEAGKIYVAVDTGRAYRWSGTQYVEIVASPGSTDALSEGTTNKYYTDAKARGAISVAANTNLSYDSVTGVITGPAAYVLPTATDTVLGGVKKGTNTNIAADGTISVTFPDAYVLPTASANDKGGVKVGTNLAIAGDVLTYKADAVETLTNKRVQPRVESQTVTTTAVNWDSDDYDQINLILTQPNTTVNLDSGTPTDGQKIVFRIKDNGTVISFTLTSSGNKFFKPIGLTLPTSTTTANKLTYIGCIYNSTGTGTWDVVAVGEES